MAKGKLSRDLHIMETPEWAGRIARIAEADGISAGAFIRQVVRRAVSDREGKLRQDYVAGKIRRGPLDTVFGKPDAVPTDT